MDTYSIALAAGRMLAARAELHNAEAASRAWVREHGDGAARGMLDGDELEPVRALLRIRDAEAGVRSAYWEVHEALRLEGVTLADACEG